MLKLNRKGYLTIEIIVASVITFIIAFFLIDLTMKLVDITYSAYLDTILTTDKTLIINNIRKEVENDMRINGDIKDVECEHDKKCTITFLNDTGRLLSVSNDNFVRYNDGETIIYSKKIHKSLSNLKIFSSEVNGYYNFKIKGENIFLDEDYEMNINVYNQSVPILRESNTWWGEEKVVNGIPIKRAFIDEIQFKDKIEEVLFEDAIASWGAAVGSNVNAITCYINVYRLLDGENYKLVKKDDISSVQLKTIDDNLNLQNNNDLKYVLTIAGNGSGNIYANPKSDFMFGLREKEINSDAFAFLKKIDGMHILNTSLATTMIGSFSFCGGLLSSSSYFDINLSDFDTMNVTNMYGMFYHSKVKKLDLTNLNTYNVTNMGSMFSRCNYLEEIDIFSLDNNIQNNFNTEKVTNMSQMFTGCEMLSKLNLSGFNTKNVMNMDRMFSECILLNKLNLEGWSTGSVTDMSYMFYGCENLSVLDVGSFETANVTNMQAMFCKCNKLQKLDLSHFNTSKVENMRSMFYECYQIKTIVLGNNFDTEKVVDMTFMFYNCNSWDGISAKDVDNNGEIKLSFNTSNVESMKAMFYKCNSIKKLNLKSFETESVSTMHAMFAKCNNLKELIIDFECANVNNMSRMFYGCSSLESLDLSNFNTSNVENMSYMFYGCEKLGALTLGPLFTTALVTDMSAMFGGCSSLESLDLSNFNTSNVENMSYMFYGCSSLTSLDLSSFNTSNVTNMRAMLYCSKRVETEDSTAENPKYQIISSLSSLILGENFNTEKVKDMSFMFYGCKRLTSLDVGSFKTANVLNMSSMFSGCSGLTEIDISSFIPKCVKKIDEMFINCSNLKMIKASTLWENNLTSLNDSRDTKIFNACSKLEAENGTTYTKYYDAAPENKITFARIDGGISKPGLFTSGEGIGNYIEEGHSCPSEDVSDSEILVPDVQLPDEEIIKDTEI